MIENDIQSLEEHDEPPAENNHVDKKPFAFMLRENLMYLAWIALRSSTCCSVFSPSSPGGSEGDPAALRHPPASEVEVDSLSLSWEAAGGARSCVVCLVKALATASAVAGTGLSNFGLGSLGGAALLLDLTSLELSDLAFAFTAVFLTFFGGCVSSPGL